MSAVKSSKSSKKTTTMRIGSIGVDFVETVPNKKIRKNGKQSIPKAVKVRKGFSLSTEDVETLKAEYKQSGVVPIPHNRGAYRAFVSALILLGVNKSHSFKMLKQAMRDDMSSAETKDDAGATAWQRFNGKESKAETPEDGLKTDGRIHQNAEVLQRLGGETPYGLRLLQVGQQILKSKGMVVDILKGKDGKAEYRLNTKSAQPINEFRRQRSN